MMKQAQQLQTQMADMQQKLQQVEMSGMSGGGMVTISINGKGEMKSIKIDPALANAEEVDILEDLIIAAFNDAKAKIDNHTAEEMSKVTGGLNLPAGLKLPF